HTKLVEHVEHVPVEIRIGEQEALGIRLADVELVHDGEVAERLLQDERGGGLQQARRASRRLQQHGFDLPPGHLVADADLRLQYQAALACEHAVIGQTRGHDERVGDGHFFVAEGAYPRRQQPDLRDATYHVAYLDQVADPQDTAKSGQITGN